MFSEADKEALRVALLASLDRVLEAAERCYPEGEWALFEAQVRLQGAGEDEVRSRLLVPLARADWAEHFPADVLHDADLEPGVADEG